MRIFKFFIIFLFTISFNLTAGPFTDEFSRCIVTKTTSQEKTDLVKWIYVTISFHPQLADMSNLSSEDVEMVNIRVADYMTNVFAYSIAYSQFHNLGAEYELNELWLTSRAPQELKLSLFSLKKVSSQLIQV